MDEGMRKLLDGSVGFFWPQPPLQSHANAEQEPERGYLRLEDDGLIHVRTLNENVLADMMTDQDGKIPDSINGITEHGGMLLLDAAGRGSTHSIGAPKASVHRYRNRLAIIGLDPRELNSTKLYSISVHFPLIGRWTGKRLSSEQWTTDSSGRNKSFSVKLDSDEGESVALPGGLSLTMCGEWGVSGHEERRKLETAIVIKVAGKRPTTWWNLLRPVIQFHDLVNIAYDGFVAVDDGRATCDTSRPPRNSPRFWSSRLMHRAPGVIEPKSMNEIPAFYLGHVAGIKGIRRWHKLCEKHPRAVRPLIGPYRYGVGGIEARYMEIAAAIEYWVKCHKKTTRWASALRPWPAALARHVGKPFDEWVGDGMKWADAFWSIYNSVKHDVPYLGDVLRMRHLAVAGELLLEAALLNRVAGSKEPSRSVFACHRYRNLGADIRANL